MTRDEFIMLVKDPGLVDRRVTGEISELIGIYPYFQSAHLLLLKGLSNSSDIKFRNQLAYSALYVSNREVLYHLLTDKTESLPVKAEWSPEESGPGSPLKETSVSEPLQREVADVISAREIQEGTVPSYMEETPVYTSETGMTAAGPGADDLLEIEEADLRESGGAVTEDVESPPVIVDALEPDNKKSQSELIDKFILENPRIEPVREKTDAPVVDISKPFVESKEGFITETLARIYLNQHYYSRAIDIYEKLSLKFPEKSSYFAAQIEKIKALIK